MSLWRNRDFNAYWFVNTVSVAGDSFSFIAVPLLVLQATGSVAQMGLLTGAAGAAAIATGTFAGTIADRVDRRLLLIVCNVARAGLLGVIPLVWLLGPRLWLLYLALPAAAGFGMIFQVAGVAVVPDLVPKEQIGAANGRLFAAQAVANIGGILTAGLVSAAFGPPVAIGVDAATFALAAAGLAVIRLRGPKVSLGRESLWRDFVSGARFLLRHRVLRALMIAMCFVVFVNVGLADIMIYYVKSDLGQSSRVVGVVMAAGTVGTLAAALLAATLRRWFGFGACWIGSIVLFGGSFGLVAFFRSIPAVAALSTAGVCFMTIAGLCSMTLRQEVTPQHMLGRVTSTYWTVNRSLGPLGAAVLTGAAARWGVAQVLLWTAVLLVLVGVTAMLTPIRLAE